MKLILGPMEGVLDGLMRQMLTELNPYDLCVTEFVRVVDAKLPAHVFYKISPELRHGGKTKTGVPVRVQLLGQSPQYMAENAAFVTELGSSGVDINFGCPSKTVNDSKGGAALLKDPALMYEIVSAIRNALPKDTELSAKVRLGFSDCTHYHEIVDAVQQGGATEIVVHGRSKEDGYKAGTVRWDLIGEIQKRLHIPVVANGDIWSPKEATLCQSITNCTQLMVCRGALYVPNLGAMIKRGQARMPWDKVLDLLIHYSEFECKGAKGFHYPNRIKQWLRYLQVAYVEAKALFYQLRTLNDKKAILQGIFDARLEYQMQKIA